ncbi:MAG: hypothetical protein IKQ16_02770 [Lentisphaeria bacterium]|nr:hypothetical protein [Lentisphaeria bacterium]
MSAQTDEDAYSPQDGTSGVPFDPADYARNEDEPSPESESGEENSFSSVPRWLQWVKRRWRNVLVWSFLALLLARLAVAFYFAGFWIGYLPQFGVLALLTAELFFSRDRCISLVSCILLVDSIIADGYHLFIYRPEWRRITFNWPYEDRFQIILVTLGLIIVVWRDRSVPRLAAAIPLLGIFLVLFLFAIASR